jgi:hypothetical protein
LKRNGEMRSPVFNKFLYKTCHTSICLPALCYTFQSYTFYWPSLIYGDTKPSENIIQYHLPNWITGYLEI